MLKVGDPVPDFAFSSEAFGSVSAASLRGKRYVMYFYPKDDTPGCTREACAFRDNWSRFGGIGVKVFGVSADDEKSHMRFARKHALPFKLIPDPDHVICEAFGTWIEKSMYGRSYMGVARSTFVIGTDAKIEKIWEKVAPDGHAEEVFAWLNGDPIPVPVKPVAVIAKTPAPIKPLSPADTKTSPIAAAKPAPVPTAAAKVQAKPVKTAVVKKPAEAVKAKPAAKPVAKTSSSKKPVAKKPAAKKPAAKKTVKAKPIAKKPVSKKAVKPASHKPAIKKAAIKKTSAKKTATKKIVAKKSAPKKSAKKSRR